jgi:hypothetical protein
LTKARAHKRAQANLRGARSIQRGTDAGDQHHAPDAVDPRTMLRKFVYDPRIPIPSGLLALMLLIAANVVPATPVGSYALCPQHAVGPARVVLSIVVGAPIGLGLMAMISIALCLALPAARTPVVTGAIRVVLARAGLGAVYGTILVVAAMVAFLDSGPPCHVDILQEIGNGATWGTLFGSGFGVLRLTIAMALAAKQTPDMAGKLWLGIANYTGLIWGFTVALLLIDSLMHGHGWPQ